MNKKVLSYYLIFAGGIFCVLNLQSGSRSNGITVSDLPYCAKISDKMDYTLKFERHLQDTTALYRSRVLKSHHEMRLKLKSESSRVYLQKPLSDETTRTDLRYLKVRPLALNSEMQIKAFKFNNMIFSIDDCS